MHPPIGVDTYQLAVVYVSDSLLGLQRISLLNATSAEDSLSKGGAAMSTNYWTTTMNGRSSRRRVLAAGGAFTAAAFLAACGGDSEDSPTEEESESGLVRAAQDTSKQAKKGGTFVRSLSADIANLDPYIPGAVLTGVVPFTHNRLVALKPGSLGPADGTIAPDLAESWEWSADALQLTLKLRQDAKFHPIAPVNGRAVTMDDVLFSIN